MLKKIIKWIFSTLITVIIAISILIIIVGVRARKNGDAPVVLGYNISVVVTESMEPTIPVGSIIIAKRTTFSSINDQDIIVYESKSGQTKGMFIVHRVIGFNDDGSLITKGDNNAGKDSENITEDMVIGVVKFHSKIFGGAVDIISAKNTVAIVLILMFSAMAIYEGVRLYFSFTKGKVEEESETDSSNEEIDVEALKAEVLKEIMEEKNKKEE